MPDKKRLPTIDELTGSDPNFTGGLSTELYLREMRGRGPEALVTLRAALAALVEEQEAGSIRTTLNGLRDTENSHLDADAALIAYIDDPEVTRLFESLERWYA